AAGTTVDRRGHRRRRAPRRRSRCARVVAHAGDAVRAGRGAAPRRVDARGVHGLAGGPGLGLGVRPQRVVVGGGHAVVPRQGVRQGPHGGVGAERLVLRARGELRHHPARRRVGGLRAGRGRGRRRPPAVGGRGPVRLGGQVRVAGVRATAGRCRVGRRVGRYAGAGGRARRTPDQPAAERRGAHRRAAAADGGPAGLPGAGRQGDHRGRRVAGVGRGRPRARGQGRQGERRAVVGRRLRLLRPRDVAGRPHRRRRGRDAHRGGRWDPPARRAGDGAAGRLLADRRDVLRQRGPGVAGPPAPDRPGLRAGARAGRDVLRAVPDHRLGRRRPGDDDDVRPLRWDPPRRPGTGPGPVRHLL
ncbi:MAG: hypothetical protein AVDCRST_MAG47-2609, partial [uncultured Nocardioidaceae bacterium]